jgi:hypothetical protein
MSIPLELLTYAKNDAWNIEHHMTMIREIHRGKTLVRTSCCCGVPPRTPKTEEANARRALSNSDEDDDDDEE